MTGMTEQLWGTVLALSPSCLIDRFLDWLEELSVSMLPAPAAAFASVEVQPETMRDPFNA